MDKVGGREARRKERAAEGIEASVWEREWEEKAVWKAMQCEAEKKKAEDAYAKFYTYYLRLSTEQVLFQVHKKYT